MVCLEERPQAAAEAIVVPVLDPAILDRDAQEELTVPLAMPTQMVVDAADLHRFRVREPMAQILFDLRPEGRHSPIVDNVFQPRSLPVRAVAEIAEDFQHGLADFQHVGPVDVAERDGQEGERLLRTRCRSEPAADQDVVSHQPSLFDDPEIPQIVGMDVGAVILG